jgi:hypothetical protein
MRPALQVVPRRPPAPDLPPAPAPAEPGAARRRYRRLLGWAFVLCSGLRVAAYVPTLVRICEQRDSSQHSLLTWGVWLVANLTMAAWLHETGPGRNLGAVATSLCNATMCAAGLGVILWFR